MTSPYLSVEETAARYGVSRWTVYERARLGELSVDLRTSRPIEIAISRRHLARHPWPEVEHTMLHEMIHQWQAETGLRVDHGPTFRARARMVGVLPRAKRGVSRGSGIAFGV